MRRSGRGGGLAHPAAGAVADQRGGLVSHLTAVESYWFERILAGLDVPTHWTGEDPDLEWRRSAGATLAGTLRRYRDQCAVSRSLLDGVDLDGTCAGRRHGAPCRSAGCFCT